METMTWKGWREHEESMKSMSHESWLTINTFGWTLLEWWTWVDWEHVGSCCNRSGRMGEAPKLVNLHPDPALKAWLFGACLAHGKLRSWSAVYWVYCSACSAHRPSHCSRDVWCTRCQWVRLGLVLTHNAVGWHSLVSTWLRRHEKSCKVTPEAELNRFSSNSWQTLNKKNATELSSLAEKIGGLCSGKCRQCTRPQEGSSSNVGTHHRLYWLVFA